jgi:outer membrane lipoprotein SlyB
MMPQQKKDDSMSKLLTIGGAVVGGVYGGGAAGAMAGASAGQMAGGLLAKQDSAPMQGVQSNAMQRRADSMQQMQQLNQSQQALAYLPPEQQAQYAPAIERARLMAQKQNGVA